jgi:hypothetical protein
VLRAANADLALHGAGVVFDPRVHDDETGDWETNDVVVGYEPGRRVAWEPMLEAASRPADRGDIRQRRSSGSEPLGSDGAVVAGGFDCSWSPGRASA